MERKAVSGIMLTLPLMGMLALAFNVQPVKAEPTTWTVDDDGGADFTRIQDAIYAASPGDTIYVYSGTYYENIVVNKDNLILIGESKETTIIDGQGTASVVYLVANNITLSGFSIQNSGSEWTESGIHFEFSFNSILSNNNIRNNGAGICLEYSSGNVVSDNNITSNGNSILLLYSSGNTLSGSNIKNNEWGIYLGGSSGNMLLKNTIANKYYGVWLYYSSGNTLSGNNITNNMRGIDLYYSSDSNEIFHNNFIDNMYQIYNPWGLQVWDDGYPSGGNYWSDYVDVDEHSGPDQDETGNDGIWDHSYDVDLNNRDRYPLVNPWVPRTIGVQVGDWVKYTVEITGYRPGFPVDLNDVEWGKTSVQAVSGTTIEVELMLHLKNGTEITMTGSVDVVTSGYPGPSNMSGLFISKDLPSGATLYATYPLGAIPPSLKINETIVKEYLGVEREANHVNATKWEIHIDAYWDKATGVLCEYKETFSTKWSLHFKIVDTNLWKAPIPTTIDGLKTKIEGLGFEGEIDNQGIVNSLIAKLNVVQRLVDKGKVDEAKTILADDFIPQVQNLSGIHITVEAADVLIKSAEYIMHHTG